MLTASFPLNKQFQNHTFFSPPYTNRHLQETHVMNKSFELEKKAYSMIFFHIFNIFGAKILNIYLKSSILKNMINVRKIKK